MADIRITSDPLLPWVYVKCSEHGKTACTDEPAAFCLAAAHRNREHPGLPGPARRPPLMRDPAAAHQLVIATVPGTVHHEMYVSCNCLREPKPAGSHGPARYTPLAVTADWSGTDPAAIWRQHMAQVGAA